MPRRTYADCDSCSCVVDRNTVAADRIRLKLNRLLSSVRRALRKPENDEIYRERTHAARESVDWDKTLGDETFDNFFTDFAGQGRIRWHYGVAHPLLCSFEDSFMADNGRGWLPEDNANRARTLVRSFVVYIILLFSDQVLNLEKCLGNLNL